MCCIYIVYKEDTRFEINVELDLYRPLLTVDGLTLEKRI